MLYTASVIPYRLAFIEDTVELVDIDIFFDVIFWIDIVISFNSTYLDDNETTIKVRKIITIEYLKGWFPIDLVSVFPISYILGETNVTNLSTNINNIAKISKLPRLYRLIKLLKLVRLAKVAKNRGFVKISKFFEEKVKFNSYIEKILLCLSAFILLNHIIACMWVYIARIQEFVPECWVVRLGFIDIADIDV